MASLEIDIKAVLAAIVCLTLATAGIYLLISIKNILEIVLFLLCEGGSIVIFLATTKSQAR